MGPGDRRFRNLTGSLCFGGHPRGWKSLRRAKKLAALTLAFAGGILLLGVAATWAKDQRPTSRTVTGVVMDDGETFIQGAMVELKDLQTKKVLDIYSQKDGKYQFTDLRFDHDYTIQASYNGLSSELRQVSSIDTRWTLVLNLTLLKPSK
jgi:hypothetical protein